jgi:hypothetical protein
VSEKMRERERERERERKREDAKITRILYANSSVIENQKNLYIQLEAYSNRVYFH